MARSQFLFEEGHLPSSLEQQAQGVLQEIERVPEDHVLQADEIEWANALAERWTIETPVLSNDVWMDKPEPVQVDVSGDAMRATFSVPAYMPGHRTVVHIPFTGEKHIFRLRPSQFTTTAPVAEVGDGELRRVFEYPDDRIPDIKGQTDGLIREVERYLEWARNDVEYYNSGLLNQAQMAIRNRRQRIEHHRDQLAATGLPVGPPRAGSTTYIADVIVRRPAPVLPSMPQGQPMELEPVLADEIYEHILSDIREHTVAMERNPKTYAAMGEEDRRNVILDALNPHYRNGTAEAFNVGGKTDMLIRLEGRNLFIGECKFWSGAKGFTETLDQLFGYQAWRDIKLAVLMFVRQRDLTAIIEKARAALAEHPQFVKWQDATTETELRATVSWLGDDRRHATLNVFFISTPTE
jgi:hypothetical protein